MLLVKAGIEADLVVENLILLIKLNMAAHYDDRLPHQEHKKAAEQGEYQDRNAEDCDLSSEAQLVFTKSSDKENHQGIILSRLRLNAGHTEVLLQHVENKSGDLGGQDRKIVGQDNEYDARQEPYPILPEILIKCA